MKFLYKQPFSIRMTYISGPPGVGGWDGSRKKRKKEKRKERTKEEKKDSEEEGKKNC